MNEHKKDSKFNLHAFVLTWIWGLGNKLYLQSAVTMAFLFFGLICLILVNGLLPLYETFIYVRIFLIAVMVLIPIFSSILWGIKSNSWLKNYNNKKHPIWKKVTIIFITLDIISLPIILYILFFLIVVSLNCTAGHPSNCP